MEESKLFLTAVGDRRFQPGRDVDGFSAFLLFDLISGVAVQYLRTRLHYLFLQPRRQVGKTSRAYFMSHWVFPKSQRQV